MGCNSKLNTLQHLRKIEVIDDKRVISTDKLTEFNRLNNVYTNEAKTIYGVNLDGKLFTIEKRKHPIKGTTIYRAIPNEEMFEGIDKAIIMEQQRIIDEETDYDFLADYAPSELKPEFKKYIEYKRNLIDRLNSRLNQIKIQKKRYSTDSEKLKELEALKRQIELRLEGTEEIPGLQAELKALEEGKGINTLSFLADRDIERLASLVESTNSQDLSEAREIINFYTKLGTFSTSEPHLLFRKEDLFNSNGELIADPTVVEGMKALKEKVQVYDNMVQQKEQEAIVELVNNNRKVQETFGEEIKFDYETLFSTKQGLKDATFYDMFVMDITNGIGSDNGLIPQVMMNLLQNEFESKLTYAKSVEERVNALQNKVEDKLRELGYGQNIIQHSQGVLYDLFRAKNENGLYTDGITQRFTAEYDKFLQDTYRIFSEKIKEAQLEENPEKKAQKYAEAYQQKINRFKQNTEILDIARLPELMQSEEAKAFGIKPVEDEAYVKKIKSLLGEQGYLEEIEKQKKLLKEYQSNLEVEIDALIAEEGVESKDQLSEKGKSRIETWELQNNPFTFVESYKSGKKIVKGNRYINSTMKYNHPVPKKIKSKLTIKDGRVQESPGEDSGFYDSRFETIEEHEVLKQFHDLLMEVSNKMYEVLPPEIRRKFNPSSIPQLEKNWREHISSAYKETEGSMFYKFVQALKAMWEYFVRNNFTSGVQSNLSYAPTDINGRPQYKVNASFLKSNKAVIDAKYQQELLRLKQALAGYGSTDRLSKFDTFALNTINQEALEVLAENLGVQPTVDSIAKRLNISTTDNIELGAVLKDGITHQIVAQNSLDLPKIMKYYSYVSMEYAARQESLPLIDMLKKHYEQIKATATTNTGEAITNARSGETRLEGLRTNANRQMESWFERAVLGNYDKKRRLDTRAKRAIKVPASIAEKRDRLKGAILGEKFLTTGEKEIRRRLEQVIQNIDNELKEATEDEAASLNMIKDRTQQSIDNLGRSYSGQAVIDSIFKFIRFKGLGFNLSSGITNFMEGQIANFISASSGDYFSSEQLYRANQIILSPTKYAYANEKKKAKLLMERYRILQDARNELQKAESKNTFLKKSKNIVSDPYFVTTYVEFRNQAPLMIAKLLDTEITGKDGQTSSVWDAINSDGTLKEDFATEENKKNWEEAKGKAYQDFASTMKKMIVNTHGDYDELRGNMASETTAGKAVLMFKRWMARQFYQRFAKGGQTDIEVGIDNYKGRYLSHNRTTAGMHSLLLGSIAFGPLGGLIMGVAGAGAGHMFGTKTSEGIFKDGFSFGKQILRDLARVSPVGRKQLEKGRTQYIEQLREAGIDERDIKNMMSNSAEAALLLSLMLLTLLVKAALKDNDGDDEDEDLWHNLVVNRLSQIIGQTTMYTNPPEALKATVGGSDLSVGRFFSDMGKFFETFTTGEWTYKEGPMAGQSKLRKDFARAFSPSITRDWVSGDGFYSFGFGSQGKKQFEPLYIDDWFENSEDLAKSDTKGIRAEYRYELRESGDYEEKEISKMVNDKYPPKKKDQTYTELLLQYESVE